MVHWRNFTGWTKNVCLRCINCTIAHQLAKNCSQLSKVLFSHSKGVIAHNFKYRSQFFISKIKPKIEESFYLKHCMIEIILCLKQIPSKQWKRTFITLVFFPWRNEKSWWMDHFHYHKKGVTICWTWNSRNTSFELWVEASATAKIIYSISCVAKTRYEREGLNSKKTGCSLLLVLFNANRYFSSSWYSTQTAFK